MSAFRTWLPALNRLLKSVCSYINRNRTQLEHSLGSSENIAKLDDVLAACNALTAVLDLLITIGT